MTFLKNRIVLAAMAGGAALGPLVVLRDALFSSETDWSGNWWMVASLTAAVVGGSLGAAVGVGAKTVLARMRPR